MKVILLADIKGKGKKDYVVEVSDVYTRNFILSKNLLDTAVGGRANVSDN